MGLTKEEDNPASKQHSAPKFEMTVKYKIEWMSSKTCSSQEMYKICPVRKVIPDYYLELQ